MCHRSSQCGGVGAVQITANDTASLRAVTSTSEITVGRRACERMARMAHRDITNKPVL